jgi:hypothetical protein
MNQKLPIFLRIITLKFYIIIQNFVMEKKKFRKIRSWKIALLSNSADYRRTRGSDITYFHNIFLYINKKSLL